MLQHAWAKFEHDIRYKGTIPVEHASDLDRRFTLAAGLLELADREFSTIRDRLQAGMTARSEVDADPRISAQDLASFLSGPSPMPAGCGPSTRLGLRAAAGAGHHLTRRARAPARLGRQRGVSERMG